MYVQWFYLYFIYQNMGKNVLEGLLHLEHIFRDCECNYVTHTCDLSKKLNLFCLQIKMHFKKEKIINI